MRRLVSLLLALVLGVVLAAPSDTAVPPVHKVGAAEPNIVALVLFGPSSSLAKKYLWQALFELWDDTGSSLRIVAASRDPDAAGAAKVADLVRSATHCGFSPAALHPRCVAARERFLAEAVSYVSVKQAEGFAHLGSVLRGHEQLPGYIGRVYYMAVGADVVPAIIDHLAGAGGLKTLSAAGEPFSRVVVEKPLGRTPEQAEAIASTLMAAFGARDTLFIDHFLGKPGLAIASGFRQRLSQLTQWEQFVGPGVAGGEAMMLEEEDCKGRTGFYDRYGVVRDVMQNHLLELLAAIQMAPSADFSDAQSRAATIARFAPLAPMLPIVQLLQYEGYAQHVQDDRAREGWTLEGAGALPPYSHFGSNYSAVTGASIGLFYKGPETKKVDAAHAGAGSAAASDSGSLYIMTAAKAAGVRSTFARQYFEAGQATSCGPISITYHVQGHIFLPPGVNVTGLPFALPHGQPALIFSAACGRAFADPTEALQPASWPFDWETFYAPANGLWVAVPRFAAWRSSAARVLGPGDSAAELAAEDAAFLTRSSLGKDVAASDTDARGFLRKYFSAKPEPEPLKRTVKARGSPKRTAPPEESDSLTKLLRHVADAPGGAASTAVYKGLIAAALAGLCGRFVSANESNMSWSVWGGTVELIDRAGAAADASVGPNDTVPGSHFAPPPSFGLPHIAIHAVGDRSWLFSLPPASADLGILPTTSMAVLRSSPARSVLSQFASDLTSLMWGHTRDRPVVHLALDAGGPINVFLDRIVTVDARSLAPWHSAYVWSARERHLGSENSVANDLIVRIVQRTAVKERKMGFLAPFAPNVTHVNLLAPRVLHQGALDIVVLLFPLPPTPTVGSSALSSLRGAVAAAAAGHPDTPELRAALQRHGAFGAMGDDSGGSLYVSCNGEAVRVAAAERERARLNPTHTWPKNPPPPPDFDKLPPDADLVHYHPFHGLPDPPLFYNTTAMDLRLSKSALRAARSVLVVVPSESLSVYEEAAAVVEVSGGGELSVPAFAGGAAALPPLFLRDLGLLVGGRPGARLYITDKTS